MIDIFDIGKIVNTHGVKGEVKIKPFTDDPQRYTKLKWVYVDFNGNLAKMHLESVKFFKGMVIVKFKEITDLNAAEALKGAVLKIDRENAVKLPKDAFFICDLIGCEVFEESGYPLGKLTDILKTGSNDVFVVKGENNREVLVPALKSVVKEISLENNKMVVQLPEGLIDDEV
ncbi:MAG: ribosome maturation factor RimM [Clostridia bacterium]|nr:ribosome maturation factor RimM [Clostridia bacterium]